MTINEAMLAIGGPRTKLRLRSLNQKRIKLGDVLAELWQPTIPPLEHIGPSDLVGVFRPRSPISNQEIFEELRFLEELSSGQLKVLEPGPTKIVKGDITFIIHGRKAPAGNVQEVYQKNAAAILRGCVKGD